MLLPLTIAAVGGYLLGSLPFGYLVARSKGVNIFEVGSKSSGATNVRRVLGRGPGNLVFVLDVLKGAAAAGWPMILRWSELQKLRTHGTYTPLEGFTAEVVYPAAAIIGLVAALIGHSYSCFTKFRGGKGVATGAGGLLVILPTVALISAAVWILTFLAFRYVSLASIVAALSLPVSAFLLRERPMFLGLTAAVALFVIVRHRANIGRLMNGTETRFTKKAGDSKGTAA